MRRRPVHGRPGPLGDPGVFVARHVGEEEQVVRGEGVEVGLHQGRADHVVHAPLQRFPNRSPAYFQMFNQSQSGGMFSVPPANIKGNFTSNDGHEVLGLFTAHDISSSNKVVIDEAIENQLRE